jgi:hypothetical protein
MGARHLYWILTGPSFAVRGNRRQVILKSCIVGLHSNFHLVFVLAGTSAVVGVATAGTGSGRTTCPPPTQTHAAQSSIQNAGARQESKHLQRLPQKKNRDKLYNNLQGRRDLL